MRGCDVPSKTLQLGHVAALVADRRRENLIGRKAPMSLLVTGSIGIDTVETPSGVATDVLGGSSIYFSLSASLFAAVRLVGVVGEDFDHALLDPLRNKGVDLRGLEVRKGSNTFRWHGKYTGAMNEAQTLAVRLNVLAERGAPLPEAFADSEFVFLANTHPMLQREFVGRLKSPRLIVSDTMNHWIESEPAELRKTLAVVHGLVLNEGEARLLSGKSNLIAAGRDILKLGPRFVVVKKAEHGSLLIAQDVIRIVPAYPTENVVDPTGCGDSFAGGMMGYLASKGRFDWPTVVSGMARGSVVASFVLESFSIEALSRTKAEDVEARLRTLAAICAFE